MEAEVVVAHYRLVHRIDESWPNCNYCSCCWYYHRWVIERVDFDGDLRMMMRLMTSFVSLIYVQLPRHWKCFLFFSIWYDDSETLRERKIKSSHNLHLHCFSLVYHSFYDVTILVLVILIMNT